MLFECFYFIYCDILPLSCDLFLLHLSPCCLGESIASIYLAFRQTPPLPDFFFYDFMLMACHYSQRYHLLSTVSLLYSLYYLCPLLLFSHFIFCPILTHFACRILFLFLLAQVCCPVTCSSRPVFITQRP